MIFLPPTDTDYVIETIGSFYHADLSANADENFWTNVSPDILINAALMQLEGSYRNTEGVKDWKNLIDLMAIDVEFDVVDQESSESRVRE